MNGRSADMERRLDYSAETVPLDLPAIFLQRVHGI